jgi:FdhD protein
VLPRSVLLGLPERLRTAQTVFDRTGGLHAAACFGADGTLTVLREDVGRHNAVDKIIGWAAFERRLPLADQVLVVSGRIGFEIAQKAAVAGIPIVCAVSAPSSLAVEVGARFGQTIVGFVRDGRANVYTRPERIDLGV